MKRILQFIFNLYFINQNKKQKNKSIKMRSRHFRELVKVAREIRKEIDNSLGVPENVDL